jgi:RHS repeat-associated protein
MNLDGVEYYYIRNAQNDIIGLYDEVGTRVASYTYDSWGKLISIKDQNGIDVTDDETSVGYKNPYRYRGYQYDGETGLFYVGSRYYDPQIGRFINADGKLNPQEGFTGMNLFQYCGSNPVNRIDPTGEAWWHWAIGAAIVVGCAVAVVATAGGAAPALLAIASVANGVAAATTASTIAAGAFIGSATAYGMAVLSAGSTSSSVKEFNKQGNWGTVVATTGGAVLGGASAAATTKSSGSKYPSNNGFNGTPRNSTIQPGSQLQRSGGTQGVFVAPYGTPTTKLSLPLDKISASIMRLEVLKPINVQSGTAMPWFGQPGGGTQFLLSDSIQNLINNGSIRIMP